MSERTIDIGGDHVEVSSRPILSLAPVFRPGDAGRHSVVAELASGTPEGRVETK